MQQKRDNKNWRATLSFSCSPDKCTLPGNVNHIVGLLRSGINSLQELFQRRDDESQLTLSQKVHEKVLLLQSEIEKC